MSSNERQLRISGVIQLIIGVCCVIFGIVERLPPERYYMTITSVPCLAIWTGLWIAITGVLGIFSKLKNSSKSWVGVYLGFSMTSMVFADVMVICYSLSLALFYPRRGYFPHISNYSGYVMSILILIFSIIESFSGIWVCCCFTWGQRLNTTPEVGQIIYMQPQGSLSPVPYVIIQGPDGRPIALPAETSDGPMTELNGTPTYSQTEAVRPRYSSTYC